MRTHLFSRTATALVATTGLLLGGATAADGKTTKPAMVPIEHHAYLPAALNVTVGQAVIWTNDDDDPHTVTTTSAPVAFDSGVFDKGTSFTYTFTRPGTYNYYCAVHPDMTGTVTVRADDPVSGALNPLMAHLQAAHFHRSVGGQVQDLAEFDSWMKMHQALFRQMLDPEVGHASTLGAAPGTGVFLQHLDAAHWNTSPAAQVAAITDDPPTWISSHQAMFQMMLTSLTAGGAHH